MPESIIAMLENPFSRPFIVIGTILFWGGALAFVLAPFGIGTVRRALGLMALALILAVVDSCVG